MARPATKESPLSNATNREENLVYIAAGTVILEGDLDVPGNAQGIVLFAHGSGSSRHSHRNRWVAQVLREAGLATLLIDVLTAQEEAIDIHTAHLRFDVGLLARRLMHATDWLTKNPATSVLPIGLFGASTGAAGALMVAAERPHLIGAVVSRGGRPDLAWPDLPYVHVPTLLIVGGNDSPVIKLNRQALEQLGAQDKQLLIVPDATHLFEEPGALEKVAQLTAGWFTRYLHQPDAAEHAITAGRH